MGITVDGLVSGIDTTAIIDAYVAQASASTDSLRVRQSDLENRKALLLQFKGLLDDLGDTIATMDTAEELQMVAVSNSSTDVLTASAEPGAQVGTYALEVERLAQAEMEVSQGFSSVSDNVGSGQISITVAGEETVIDVSSAEGNDTLSTLVDSINANVDGVSAYLFDDGDPTNPYRLVVVSEDTGAANTIEIDTSGLGGGTAPSFTEQLSASDASIRLGSMSIRSATNRFEGIIPGVTFDAISLGTAQVTVTSDRGATVDAVQQVVDSYNAVMDFIDDYVGLDSSGNPSALGGETVLRTVQRSLQEAVSSLYTSGDLQGASSLGFATTQDGTLSLDAEKLSDALESSSDDVMEILTGTDGLFAGLTDKIDMVVDSSTGTLTLRTESIDALIETFQEQIDASEASLAKYEETMRQQFTNLEMAMAELQTMGTYLASLFASTDG